MKTPDLPEGKSSALNKRNSTTTKFAGTDNPRHLRVIHALLTRSRRRQDIDAVAGAANGPDLIFDLRDKGLEIPCIRVEAFDRDGLPCRPGVYHLTDGDRKKLNRWQSKRQKGAIDLTLLAGWIVIGAACLMLHWLPVGVVADEIENALTHAHRIEQEGD